MSFRAPEGNSRREPITTAVRITDAVLVDDGDGFYSIATTGEPDAVLEDSGDGFLEIAPGGTEAATLLAVGPTTIIED